MAGVDRLITTTQLKTGLLKKLAREKGSHGPFLHYDEDLDELTIMVVPPETETIVHYVDGEEFVALLYEADTFEIVGLQIEEFQKGFVPRYSSVEKAWRLSDCVEIGNVWDLQLTLGRLQPKVAREIARAAIAVIGEPAKRLERVFA